MMHRTALWTATALATAALFGAGPASAKEGLVCLAASDPADAAKPLAAIDSLEFYADEGNPALSYSFPLTLVRSDVDPKGRIRNAYRVRDETAVGAAIIFSRATPLTFTINELGRSYASLAKNDDETEFMTDAVPGIACYTVTMEKDPL